MTCLELARRVRGWTQRELGEHPKVRIHQSFISQLERGAGLPSPDQRQRLARALGVPPDNLLDPVSEARLPVTTETVEPRG